MRTRAWLPPRLVEQLLVPMKKHPLHVRQLTAEPDDVPHRLHLQGHADTTKLLQRERIASAAMPSARVHRHEKGAEGEAQGGGERRHPRQAPFVRPSAARGARRPWRAPPLPRLRWSRGRTLRPPWVVARSARLWTPPPWRSVLETPPVARQPPRRDQLRRGLAGSWISGGCRDPSRGSRPQTTNARLSTANSSRARVIAHSLDRAHRCDGAVANAMRRGTLRSQANLGEVTRTVLPKAKNQRHEIEST